MFIFQLRGKTNADSSMVVDDKKSGQSNVAEEKIKGEKTDIKQLSEKFKIKEEDLTPYVNYLKQGENVNLLQFLNYIKYLVEKYHLNDKQAAKLIYRLIKKMMDDPTKVKETMDLTRKVLGDRVWNELKELVYPNVVKNEKLRNYFIQHDASFIDWVVKNIEIMREELQRNLEHFKELYEKLKNASEKEREQKYIEMAESLKRVEKYIDYMQALEEIKKRQMGEEGTKSLEDYARQEILKTLHPYMQTVKDYMKVAGQITVPPFNRTPGYVKFNNVRNKIKNRMDELNF